MASLVLANSYRIKTLELTGPPHSVFDFVDKMCNFDFPKLQMLRLFPDSSSMEEDGKFPHAHLPPALFGRAPRLGRLFLTQIDAPLRNLPPLRSLALELCPGPIALDALLAVLRSSPELRMLWLERNIYTRLANGGQPVRLAHLERLTILDTVQQSEELLRNILFPPTTRLKLLPRWVTTSEDIGGLAAVLKSVRGHVRAAPASSLEFFCAPPDPELHWTLMRIATHDNPASCTKDPSFFIHSHPRDALDMCQIMATILDALPLQRITHLNTTGAEIPSVAWNIALARLPALEEAVLSVTAHGMRFCEVALEIRPPLRGLIIHAAAESAEDPEIVLRFFAALTNLLRARRKDGKPLERLQVQDAFELGAEQLAELRDLVGSLIWIQVDPTLY
ncbi:hypothetical protein K438DRAFT_2144324 [Mycena galopus ATCC 62051]|nr:hypothetical protein K438DRAFT_2144324 [Mycena galopus ATCC 62051]